jgi:hypothetical protein
MTVSYEHPVGALEPPLRLELRQPATVGETGARREDDGSWTKPIDLTSAVSVTARLYMLGSDSSVDFSRDAVFIDRAGGAVDVVWQSGDELDGGPLSVPLAWRVLARISWPGNRPQDVPQRREDAFTLRVIQPAP